MLYCLHQLSEFRGGQITPLAHLQITQTHIHDAGALKLPHLVTKVLAHAANLAVEAFNQGHLAVVDELLSPDYFTHTAFGGGSPGPVGLKWLIAMFRTAFPDLHCTVEGEIREGDQFAAHWMMNGTHRGLFMGNPPTGRQVNVQGMIFCRIENGRLVEDWTLIDQIGILQQLGLVPPVR